MIGLDELTHGHNSYPTCMLGCAETYQHHPKWGEGQDCAVGAKAQVLPKMKKKCQ